MVHMSHYSNDWSSLNLMFSLLINIQDLLQISLHKTLSIQSCFFFLEQNTQIFSNQRCCIKIQTCIQTCHNTICNEFFHHLRQRNSDLFWELFYSNIFINSHLCFLYKVCWSCSFLMHLWCNWLILRFLFNPFLRLWSMMFFSNWFRKIRFLFWCFLSLESCKISSCRDNFFLWLISSLPNWDIPMLFFCWKFFLFFWLFRSWRNLTRLISLRRLRETNSFLRNFLTRNHRNLNIMQCKIIFILLRFYSLFLLLWKSKSRQKSTSES